MLTDRIKQATLNLVRSALPTFDYFGVYRSRIVTQTSQTVDVIPDDTKVPPMSGIPLRFGLPGVTVTLDLSQSQYVLVGFMGGDPSLPYIAEWEGGEPIGTIRLGGANLSAVLDGLVHGRGIDSFTGLSYGAMGNTTAHLLAVK